MPVYLVPPADEAGHMVVYVFPSLTEARSAATRSDRVIGHPSDIIWSGRLLLDIYNTLGGRRKSAFDTWTQGTEAMMELLPRVAKPYPGRHAETASVKVRREV